VGVNFVQLRDIYADIPFDKREYRGDQSSALWFEKYAIKSE
jgi:hypothetical protein